MSWSPAGAARVLVTVGLVGGLLFAAGQRPGAVDLTALTGPARSDQAGPAAAQPPSSAVLTCVGPELSGVKGVPDIAQNLTVAAESAPREATGATGTGSLRLAAPGADPLAESTTGSVAGAVPSPGIIEAMGKGVFAPGLSALQQSANDSPEARGLATLPCTTASAESWLIAGGGAPGRQERLVLANPGANEITVDVSVLGAKGPVTADNGRGVVVPGRGRTNVLVDAIAGGEPTPVIHVSVHGGTAVAALMDAWLDGSVAAGVEATTETAPPATTQIIPLVDLAQAGLVRVAVPGNTQGVVRVRLLTTTGPAPLPDGGVQRIPARSSLDVPLRGIPGGAYALEVSADVPVVAAAFSQARDASGPGDFAWTPATTAVTGVAGIPLPTVSGTHQLALATGDAAAAVQVYTRTGETVTARTATVEADRVSVVDLGGAESVWIAGAKTPVYAAVLTTVGTGATRMIAVAPLTDLTVSVTATRSYPQP
ncbi:MAG TPA: DUF5719 family protein [Phycicoccus sp.]|nr:DUF5719 family protein [Phycicoccus sp.]